MSKTEFNSEQYVTHAVHSGIEQAGGEEIGHIGIFDVDTGRGDAMHVAESLPSRAFILRTSTGKYHVWTMGIMPFNEWLELAHRDLPIDQDQLAVSEDRGYFVGRIEPKVRMDTGERIAPKPKVVASVGRTRGVESKPHYRYINELADVEIEPSAEARGDIAESRVFHQAIDGGEP